jgi:citrate lyase beta subunit
VRQPVHTVYVPADRFDAGTVAAYGDAALGLLDECAAVLEASPDLVDRVKAKLSSQPVEDLRIDFEDGYGVRPDDVEDADVRRVAGAGHGIRFKSLEPATRERGLRTLRLWAAEGGTGRITLPKVTAVGQVEELVRVCDELGLAGFEIQVETPQSVLLLPELIRAASGRCTGLHFGTYDYTASVGVAAPYQSLEHPAADHAKSVMQLVAAGTGIELSDGSTNILPVGERRADAWLLHARLVRRSLERGFYQGWDLHPAQLPSRFLATYAFYRDGLARLDEVDLTEPAAARAWQDFLRRGVDCGAIDRSEVPL